jgi:hypothetical protein
MKCSAEEVICSERLHSLMRAEIVVSVAIAPAVVNAEYHITSVRLPA